MPAAAMPLPPRVQPELPPSFSPERSALPNACPSRSRTRSPGGSSTNWSPSGGGLRRSPRRPTPWPGSLVKHSPITGGNRAQALVYRRRKRCCSYWVSGMYRMPASRSASCASESSSTSELEEATSSSSGLMSNKVCCSYTDGKRDFDASR
jgi:hypothetical protein